MPNSELLNLCLLLLHIRAASNEPCPLNIYISASGNSNRSASNLLILTNVAAYHSGPKFIVSESINCKKPKNI